MIVDEDVPGGGSGYILSELIKNQKFIHCLIVILFYLQQKITDLHMALMEIIFQNLQKKIFMRRLTKLCMNQIQKKYPEI